MNLDTEENNINPSEYYSEWQNNRIKFILEKYDPSFFNGKTVLELGSCNGYIGSYFQKKLGCKVLSVEGRKENIENIRKNYPDLDVVEGNLDTEDWIYGKFDIIINFGLFYHLEKFHVDHLVNCVKNCDLLFFESVIIDSFEKSIYFHTEQGYDQSLSDRGGTPSTSFVEHIFNECGCEFTKYSDNKLNGESHRYDWEDSNSRTYNPWTRRFWIVETNN